MEVSGRLRTWRRGSLSLELAMTGSGVGVAMPVGECGEVLLGNMRCQVESDKVNVEFVAEAILQAVCL
jgi:hypothetical protein